MIEKRTNRDLKKLLRVGNSHRLVSMQDLFKEDEESQSNDEGIRTKLQRLSSKQMETKSEHKRFKNSSVANAIHRIRREKWT